MQSIIQNLGGSIVMPSFQGRKLYMHKTRMDDVSLPAAFHDFNSAIASVLNKVNDKDNVCYITIDEKRICNETHRRAGAHVDFNWFEATQSHDTIGHRMKAGWDNGGGWGKGSEAGGMLLVSNYPGCRVWSGEYEGEILEGGDCSKIDLSAMDSEIMPANEVYFINALGVHESLVINQAIERTLIRINFHPEYIFQQ